MNVVALAGGVGGAKLADGLQRIGDIALTVVVNTADDFELHGLQISPDLDTVMYTLAGIANPQSGWGIAGDTFQALQMFTRYAADDWFRLGDRDLATHIVRTQQLRAGQSLTQVTMRLAQSLGVRATILPMSDDKVATVVDTFEGKLAFQEYFVHRHCEPVVKSIRFAGLERAQPTAEVLSAIAPADAIVFCPSNPFVSLEPILSLRSVRERIRQSAARTLAVSPIVGGEALKGPAAKMFRELGLESSALAVARRYVGLVEGFILDQMDAPLASEIQRLGMSTLTTNTVMTNDAERERLARDIIAWVKSGLRE